MAQLARFRFWTLLAFGVLALSAAPSNSPENFPGPDTRQAAGPKYADRFIGFRVVLVPQ